MKVPLLLRHGLRGLLGAALLSTAPHTSAQVFEDILAAVADDKGDKEEKKSDDKSDTKGKSYDKVITPEAITKRGFVTVHKVKDKVYLEIPLQMLERPMLFSGRVTATSNNKDVIAGQMAANPIVVGWSKDDTRVYLHALSHSITADPEESIYQRVMDNSLQPVLNAFKIETWSPDSSAVVFNATALFLTAEAPITPFIPASPLDGLFGGKKLTGAFKKDLSSILDISAYPTNINVQVRAVYTVSKEPFTAIINAGLLLLPEQMMRPRLADQRIGYFTDQTTVITTRELTLDRPKYINRFRLEPAPADVSRMRSGQLVAPLRPITFYIDDAFPEAWWPYLKAGVEDWNKAFEAAGFKNAVIAKKYPKGDPDFDPYDARFNCIIYSSSQTANAMGPSWTDPRSGEILQASVYFYHNVLELLHSWRFVQTSAADPKARTLQYDLSVLGPMLRYLIAHEVGHTLGLMHNMGASHAYTVANLRDPSFTTKYGTTPSIMDYARNNYVAQPGDGVTYFMPPHLGIYDIYAIQWGYKPIFSAKTPKEEVPTLNKWIAAKAGDLRYAYGPQQILQHDDPYAQTEDLGDDAVLASKLGIENLKRTTQHLFDWTEKKDDTYRPQQRLYRSITSQFRTYLGHCSQLIGGARNNLAVQGDGQPAYSPAPKEKQREAVRFVIDQTLNAHKWLITPEVRDKLAISENNISDLALSLMNGLVSGGTIGKIAKNAALSSDPYTVEMYMDDLSQALWSGSTEALSPAAKNMQYAYVTGLITTLDLKADAKTRDKVSTAKINAKGVLFEKLLEAQTECRTRAHNANAKDRGHYTSLLFLINEVLEPMN